MRNGKDGVDGILRHTERSEVSHCQGFFGLCPQNDIRQIIFMFTLPVGEEIIFLNKKRNIFD